jgi:hypothetical protein
VDLCHAREHLHDLARSMEFMLRDRKDERLAARLEDLDYGDTDGIVRATPYLLHQAQASMIWDLGSPAVPVWLIAPCSRYGLGVLPLARSVREPLMGTCGLIADS